MSNEKTLTSVPNISNITGFHETLEWLDNQDAKICKEQGDGGAGNGFQIAAAIIRMQQAQIEGLQNVKN